MYGYICMWLCIISVWVSCQLSSNNSSNDTLGYRHIFRNRYSQKETRRIIYTNLRVLGITYNPNISLDTYEETVYYYTRQEGNLKLWYFHIEDYIQRGLVRISLDLVSKLLYMTKHVHEIIRTCQLYSIVSKQYFNSTDTCDQICDATQDLRCRCTKSVIFKVSSMPFTSLFHSGQGNTILQIYLSNYKIEVRLLY